MHKAILCAGVMITAACTAHAPADNRLAGSQWRFIAIDRHKPASPDKARLDFVDGMLSANVGCNGLGSGWKIDQGRLIAGPLLGTRMYCQGPVWAQEQAIGALLIASPSVKVSGDQLILKSGGHEAKLERISPPKPGL